MVAMCVMYKPHRLQASCNCSAAWLTHVQPPLQRYPCGTKSSVKVTVPFAEDGTYVRSFLTSLMIDCGPFIVPDRPAPHTSLHVFKARVHVWLQWNQLNKNMY
ncbi:hypothetical protein GWK47_023376 [Chionoecetes opilio]|uniref:Uncharacterized protein n=1 Tax=Chionoecetes opilio TaxID=41210 RepID=A0A8J4XLV0_CHIOP|nr:hypothetical protein GWK47_023376 [Chionoecetes opilio]